MPAPGPAPRVAGLDEAARGAPIFAARRTAHEHRPGRPVTHDVAVLALHTGGGARVEQRSTWTLGAGDLLIVPAGEPHRHVETTHAEVWALGFCVPCLAADGLAPGLLDPLDRVRGGASPVVHIPADRRPFLESLFQELSATPPAAGDGSVQRSLLTLVLHEVARAAGSGEAKDRSAGVVAESLRVIERRCLGPLTLEEVAAAVRRTPSYVTTALTRATGRSAVAWMIAYRMAEARRRLVHSDEQIEIIAERVGYADATHFIRLFRREHGMTPAAWRAARRATSVIDARSSREATFEG